MISRELSSHVCEKLLETQINVCVVSGFCLNICPDLSGHGWSDAGQMLSHWVAYIEAGVIFFIVNLLQKVGMVFGMWTCIQHKITIRHNKNVNMQGIIGTTAVVVEK